MPGTTPPDQCFEPRQPPVGQIDDRLVFQDEFIAIDRSPKGAFDFESRSRFRVHFGIEDHVPAASRLLCPMHGGIGISQHLARLPVGVGTDGDADADRDEDFVIPRQKRFVESTMDPFEQTSQRRRVPDVLEQQRKLVGTETGQ